MILHPRRSLPSYQSLYLSKIVWISRVLEIKRFGCGSQQLPSASSRSTRCKRDLSSHLPVRNAFKAFTSHIRRANQVPLYRMLYSGPKLDHCKTVPPNTFLLRPYFACVFFCPLPAQFWIPKSTALPGLLSPHLGEPGNS